jgi:hypothetical protein
MDYDLLGYNAASAGPGNYGALKMRTISCVGKSVLEYKPKWGGGTDVSTAP